VSLAYYISLQNKDPGFDIFVNGKAIAHASDQLGEISKAIGVTPIDEFHGKKWHDPDVGLKTVYALMAYLKENPSALSDTEEIVDDLKEWEDVLQKARAASIKWKMKIDY
jgi:hypothetical protein